MAARLDRALGVFLVCLALTWACAFSPQVGNGPSSDSATQQDGVSTDRIGYDGSILDGADAPHLKDAPGNDLTDSSIELPDGAIPDTQTTELLAEAWHGDTIPDAHQDTQSPADSSDMVDPTDTFPDADGDTQTMADSLDVVDAGDAGEEADTWTPDPWQPCGLDGFCWQEPMIGSGAVGKWPGAGTLRYQMTLGWHRGMAVLK